MVLHCQFSALAFSLLIALHCLAALALLLGSALSYLSVFGFLVIAISLLQAWREYGPNSRQRIRLCRIGREHSTVQTADKQIRCHLPELVYLSEFVVVLKFPVLQAQAGKGLLRSRKLILPADALCPGEQSALRRYFRFDRGL